MCSNIRQKFATGDYQEYYICVRFLQSTKTVINRLIKKQKKTLSGSESKSESLISLPEQ